MTRPENCVVTRSSPTKNDDRPQMMSPRMSSPMRSQSTRSRLRSIACETQFCRSQSSYSCCGSISLILLSRDSSRSVPTSPCDVSWSSVDMTETSLGYLPWRNLQVRLTLCQDALLVCAVMAVLSRRQDTSEQRRAAEAEFTRATVDLLAHGDSYADLSVERIAAAAGRTRTAFYFYFRDKRELLMRATETVAEQLYA